MTPFAALLDALACEPQQEAKIRLLTDYLARTPDPDRGYALGAIMGVLDIQKVKPALLRGLLLDRVDEQLFALSHDYVGDLTETVSLLWPGQGGAAPPLGRVVERLLAATRLDRPPLIASLLSSMDADERWALVKLVTGGLRAGVSAPLARAALAATGGVSLPRIEAAWHGLGPPYTELFAWIEGHAGPPPAKSGAVFRPVMGARAIADMDFETLDPADFAVEWTWDGARVQAVCEAGERRLFGRSGDDISASFPEIVSRLTEEGAIDGELLIVRDGAAMPASEPQKRLGRKTVSARTMEEAPAALRAYDLLMDRGEDLRAMPWESRRARLEAFIRRLSDPRIALSPVIPVINWAQLRAMRAAPPDDPALGHPQGLVLKHRNAPYEAGRADAGWIVWKREPETLDAVLMYAQRGQGKRSAHFAHVTFGVWADKAEGPELVPVGRADLSFDDAVRDEIDAFVRDNTVSRFGPVHAVAQDAQGGLVLEIAIEGLQRSGRHKSGIALRAPRILRVRRDKSAGEACSLETLGAQHR